MFLKVIVVRVRLLRRSGGEAAMVRWRARNSCRKDARRIGTAKHRARTRLKSVLGERRRRVLEDARVDEWRRNPDWMQRRNETELEQRSRSRDQRTRGLLLIIAGTNQSHGALMPGRSGVGMD